MKLAIPTIASEDLEIANSAEIGAESTLRICMAETLLVGELRQGTTNEWVAENAYVAPSGTAGRDLIMVCANGVRSTEEIIVTFAITMEGSGTPAGTAEARFAPPARMGNDSFNMPVGLAVDMKVLGTSSQTVLITTVNTSPAVVVDPSDPMILTSADEGKVIAGTGITGGTTILSVQGPKNFTLSAAATAGGTVTGTIAARTNAAKKIRTITAINSIVGGASGNKWQVLYIPDDWIDVNCTTDKNPTIPVGKTVAIACGYNAARWTKKGRSEVPTLEISAKYSSYMDGLSRLAGHRVTAMLEIHKEDRLLSERMIFGNWRPVPQPKKGDGDAEATVTATGSYEYLAVFN